MPYAHTRKKIPRKLDRRVKASEEDKDMIKEKYRNGETIRAIARSFRNKFTRRVVQYVLFPERYAMLLANSKKRRKLKGNTLQEYGRKAWAKTIREHRHYKQSIKNKLI